MPIAKIGRGNFIYTYSNNSQNWYGILAITQIGWFIGNTFNTSIPVIEAYNIDKKVDDGLPTTGNVQAVYVGGNSPNGNPDTASTCYNNSTYTYSTNISNGSNPNCALSFKMQGAVR